MSAIVFIPIGNGKVTVIDFEDKEKVCRYRWTMNPFGYARSHINKKHTFLHRLILTPPKGMFIDHINGDKLDNRKSNLRICTQAQNCQNSKGKSTRKHPHLPKGVYYQKPPCKRKFVAEIRVNGKRKLIGSFFTVEEAKDAYNKTSIELCGEFHKP